jgi:hypothetical protein
METRATAQCDADQAPDVNLPLSPKLTGADTERAIETVRAIVPCHPDLVCATLDASWNPFNANAAESRLQQSRSRHQWCATAFDEPLHVGWPNIGSRDAFWPLVHGYRFTSMSMLLFGASVIIFLAKPLPDQITALTYKIVT